MAFTPTTMRQIEASRDGVVPTRWHYTTADAFATVAGSGYFTGAWNYPLRTGDLVFVQRTTSGTPVTVMVVTSVTAGAATVTSQTGRTASPGVGITGGTGTIFRSSVTVEGDMIKTSIMFDLTGLNSGGTAGDIIGTNGAGVAHLGQITAAINGTIIGGYMRCIETPAGGDTDFDLYAATPATGVEDVAISTLAGQTQVINSGVQALGTVSLVIPDTIAANSYLYFVGQGVANATYTAGRGVIILYGI